MFPLLILAAMAATGARAVTIREADHEGRAQFKVETAAATYFFDRAGGGFSRLLDRDGRDWIAFNGTNRGGPRRERPFGRGPDGPQLRGAGQRFVIGFVEERVTEAPAHARVSATAGRWLQAAETSGAVTATTLPGGTDPASPVIDVWYGDEQHFGRLSVPQKWVNILGRVQARASLSSLQYSLNGDAPRKLSVGADGKRLARPGDFNLDLEFDALRAGANHLAIVATDAAGRSTGRNVTVFCHRGNVWPLPYTVDWSRVRAITDAVQVVDGNGKLESGGVRTVEPYYDRILAFGDRTWTDYTVTVEVTFHGYTPPHGGAPTYGVSHAAIAARFPGHFADQLQPHVQWYPLGAVAEFRLGAKLEESSWRIFRDGTATSRAVAIIEPRLRRVELGVRYRLKLRVDSLPGPAARYRVKSWRAGETEPAAWEVDSKEGGATVPAGGALLVSHNTDVTFGTLEVTANVPEPR